MRILSLDTATPSCSAAVTDQNVLLAEFSVTATGQSHSRQVMAMIRQVIDRSGLTLGAIDGFAVSRGPGSFTGLRIGISTIKGLAAASGKPMVGVSSLKALAMQATAGSSLICPLLDARKGEVYFAFYRFTGGVLIRQGEERVLPPEKAIEGVDGPCLFIGPGAVLYREIITGTLGGSAVFAPASHHTIRASTLACLARDRLESAETDDVKRFVPVYIRKSDAEIHLKSRKPLKQ